MVNIFHAGWQSHARSSRRRDRNRQRFLAEGSKKRSRLSSLESLECRLLLTTDPLTTVESTTDLTWSIESTEKVLAQSLTDDRYDGTFFFEI